MTAVNDAPTGVVANLHAAEDSANGSAAGTIVGQDPDSSSFTYTLLDNAGGRFAMDSAGHVTVADGLLLDYRAGEPPRHPGPGHRRPGRP